MTLPPLFGQPTGDIGVSTEAPVRWQDQGACKNVDPDIFFPQRGESIGEARMICHGCPVKRECGDYAIEHREIHGVWGGLSERQRRAIRSRRGKKRAS